MRDRDRSRKSRAESTELAEFNGTEGRKRGTVALGLAGVILVAGLAWWAVSAAQNFGAGIGNTAGRFAGTVKGSFEGITQGLESGYEAGTEQGLSAEDTDVDVNEIKGMGKLDVLAAEDHIVNNFQEGEDYKALFVYKAEATFSVDLSQAEIADDGSVVTITIPGLEVDFMIDENESEKMAEWQKHFWSGKTEAGYIGYMNSMAQIKEKAAEEMKKNDYLMKQAEESARKQVETLARSMCVGKRQINVVIKEEGK